MLGDKDVVGVLAELEPVLDEVVITQASAARAMPADELAVAAVEVFGADRVTVEPRLDVAIETAVELAEETGDDLRSGSGVLITGSVFTAGQARLLLGRGDDRVTDRTRRPGPTPEQLAERAARADRATRGAAAAILGLEALVVLLLPRAIAYTASGLGGTRTGILIALAVLLIVAAGLQRRPWGIAARVGDAGAVRATGVLLVAMFFVGALFVLVWLWLLNIRHDLVGTPDGWRLLVS